MTLLDPYGSTLMTVHLLSDSILSFTSESLSFKVHYGFIEAHNSDGECHGICSTSAMCENGRYIE